jgi:hypothetical protein
MKALRSFFLLHWLLLGLFVPLHAQRPVLFTESPESVGDGQLSVGVGIEYLKKNTAVPVRAPLSLWRVPTLRGYIGIGDIVDLVVDWRGRLFAKQGTGRHVSDWGDVSLGTKINFLKETNSRPALGAMYLVKLPNTSHDELLGSNEIDLFLSFLATKRIDRIQLRANIGLGILDDPDHPHTQLDIYTMGVAVTFPLAQEHRFFLEWTGFLGSHSDEAKFLVRSGVTLNILKTELSLFGSGRVRGDEKDFGTAFEYSERWSVGFFLRREFSLW